MNKHYMVWYILFAAIALLAAVIPATLSGRLEMLHVVVGLIVAVVMPPVLIWLAQKMGYPIGRAVSCPKCRTELPLFRKPQSLRQGLSGGYQCPGCGAQLDARARELAPDTAR